jgi:hypothetical protein
MSNADTFAKISVDLAGGTIKKTAACEATSLEFSCVNFLNNALSADSTGKMVPMYATLCNDDGTKMMPCYDWCYSYYTSCMTGQIASDEMAKSLCNGLPKTKCYGNNDVKGMKSASARVSVPTLFVLAPLAFAVTSLGVLSAV